MGKSEAFYVGEAAVPCGRERSDFNERTMPLKQRPLSGLRKPPIAHCSDLQ